MYILSKKFDRPKCQNYGYQLAYELKCKQFFNLWERLGADDEESCPVYQEEDCPDWYTCLKEAKITKVRDEAGTDVHVAMIQRCDKCQWRHPETIPEACQDPPAPQNLRPQPGLEPAPEPPLVPEPKPPAQNPPLAPTYDSLNICEKCLDVGVGMHSADVCLNQEIKKPQIPGQIE